MTSQVSECLTAKGPFQARLPYKCGALQLRAAHFPFPKSLLFIPTTLKAPASEGELQGTASSQPLSASRLLLPPSHKRPVPPQKCFEGPYKSVSCSESLEGCTSLPLAVDRAYKATVAFTNISLTTFPISPIFIRLQRQL